MRKVIKHPDGREETVEGTPEEIAEYERQLREGGKPRPGKKKPVLHGAEVDGKPLTDDEVNLVRLSRAGLLPKERKEPAFVPFTPYTPVPWPVMPDPYWLRDIPCSFCGKINCHELHIWCEAPVTRTITITGNSTVPHDKAFLVTDGRAQGVITLQETVDKALASFDLINKGWTPEIKTPSS